MFSAFRRVGSQLRKSPVQGIGTVESHGQVIPNLFRSPLGPGIKLGVFEPVVQTSLLDIVLPGNGDTGGVLRVETQGNSLGTHNSHGMGVLVSDHQHSLLESSLIHMEEGVLGEEGEFHSRKTSLAKRKITGHQDSEIQGTTPPAETHWWLEELAAEHTIVANTTPELKN